MEMSSTQSTGALTAESPTTSVGTEPAAKRRKTGNGTSSHKKGLNKEKMSRVAAVRDAKFKNAMNVLRAFAKDHGGKLPSLRFMMKMLKVGFPKAHEIKKQYGEREGYTVCICTLYLHSVFTLCVCTHCDSLAVHYVM